MSINRAPAIKTDQSISPGAQKIPNTSSPILLDDGRTNSPAAISAIKAEIRAEDSIQSGFTDSSKSGLAVSISAAQNTNGDLGEEGPLSAKSMVEALPSSSIKLADNDSKAATRQTRSHTTESASRSFTFQIKNTLAKMTQPESLKLQSSYKNLHASKSIDEFLKLEKKDYAKFKDEPKILILGSSDSGKSTLLKQLKIMHSKFTDEELKEAKSHIYSGIALAILILVGRWCIINDAKLTGDAETDGSVDLIEHYTFLLTTAEHINGGARNVAPFIKSRDQIKNLWKEPAVQSIFEQGEHGLPDTTSYFMNEIDRILIDEYVPTEQDILNVRVETKQVSETVFTIKKQNYHFYDVSGMKKDRGHWLQFFDNSNIVLYVTSISSYDQMMKEDPTVNRMADSLVLLNQMANHKLLLTVPFVLFLNKKDLFKKKVKTKPITIMFPDYTEDVKDPNLSARFIINKFTQQCPEKKSVTTHLTCATDTASMQVIISQVIFQTLQKSVNDVFNTPV